MHNITQRKKKPKNNKHLWNLFDKEIGRENPQKSLEILYSRCKLGPRDKCELCGSGLSFGEDKFLTCTNLKCGTIYKDTLDQTAEWRYYGSEDNKSSDPTRCGMPSKPFEPLRDAKRYCLLFSKRSWRSPRG